jgi:putative transcriptional regulator
MSIESKPPAAIAESFGKRLKQARLNADMTQVDVAEQAGISRKAVLTAEKSKAKLETLIAIMQALQLTDQKDNFLPTQDISPYSVS